MEVLKKSRNSGSEIFCEPVRAFMSRCTAQHYVIHWDSQMREVWVSDAGTAGLHGHKHLVETFCKVLVNEGYVRKDIDEESITPKCECQSEAERLAKLRLAEIRRPEAFARNRNDYDIVQ